MLHTKFSENTSTLKDGMGKIEEYIRCIEELKGENVALRNKKMLLEMRIDGLQTCSRSLS